MYLLAVLLKCRKRGADLPDPHARHGSGEGLLEQLAHLVGVGADLRQVVDEQQHSGERVHAREQAEVAELHQELNVLCKQALRTAKQEAL